MREFDYECKKCGCEVTQFEFRENGGLCDTCVKAAKTAAGKQTVFNGGFSKLFPESEEEAALKKARETLFGKK